jgi:hypothetical protein
VGEWPRDSPGKIRKRLQRKDHQFCLAASRAGLWRRSLTSLHKLGFVIFLQEGVSLETTLCLVHLAQGEGPKEENGGSKKPGKGP